MKNISLKFYNMWGGFFEHDNIITNTLRKEYDVTITDSNPDIVICQVSPASHQAPPPERFTSGFTSSKIIHWLVESIDRTGDPDYSKCDFSISSCKFEDDRNVRIPLWAMYVNWFGDQQESYVEGRNQAFLLSAKKLTNQVNVSQKSKFCSILTNNDMGYRKEAYPKFINFGIDNGLLVESRGRAFTNMPSIGGDEKHKLEYLSDFKFNLCFDNGESDGWITEKIIHPKYVGSIPIYWGCKDVAEEFNEEAFLHVRNFENLEHLHEKVLELCYNTIEYKKIQTLPCFPDNKIPECVNQEFLLEQLKGIVEA